MKFVPVIATVPEAPGATGACRRAMRRKRERSEGRNRSYRSRHRGDGHWQRRSCQQGAGRKCLYQVALYPSWIIHCQFSPFMRAGLAGL